MLRMEIFQQQYERNLDENREKQDSCLKHKEELCRVQSQLETLPNELSYDIMIPIGSQGLMRGKMVHTNEILALIGDSWYVKTSAKQAREMCQRRIERCEEVLNKYVKEFELMKSWHEVSHDVFQPPEEGVREITEEFDEEKEKDWKVLHRENVRKHYLELAKLRNKENKTTSDDEETLRRRLDELELQEEIEDELIRSGEDVDEMPTDSDDASENSSAQDDAKEKESSSGGASCPKRRVSFSEKVQELDLEHYEKKPKTLKIFFHHSDIPIRINKETSDKDGTVKSPQCELESPSDMYTHFASLFPAKTPPKGILKQTSRSSSVEENSDIISTCLPLELSQPSRNAGMGDSYIKDASEEDFQSVAFGDVIVEHNPVVEMQVPEEHQVNRPVSRFKASRQKQKFNR